MKGSGPLDRTSFNILKMLKEVGDAEERIRSKWSIVLINVF